MTILDIFTILLFIVVIGISVVQTYLKERKNKDIQENNEESKIDSFCNKYYKVIWVIFIIILFITVIYRFGELPTYIGIDEAGMAYDAMTIADYGVDRYLNSYPLYLTNFGGGQSVLCGYMAAVFIKLMGVNQIAYRLPALIIYIIGMISSYLFVSKSKDKKTALLFTFLIITCPWNIMNARQALDCNLFGGMLMLNLLLMNRAKKNYQYILAGISVGITLYTYCLTWITIPIFLAVWIIYMLYIKRIKFKEIVLFGIPIAIFAVPLIYFLLLNYGIVNQSQIGIFTLPILSEFRGEQIAISNIWAKGLGNLKTIFLSEKTIYPLFVPLFLIGYIISIKDTIVAIKKKEYTVTAIITLTFTTILLGLSLVNIPTPNKANALYIPILYFVAIAILEICKNSKVLLIISILIITVLFVNFEYKYYSEYAYVPNTEWYEDNELGELTKKLEENEETKDIEKHIMVYKTSPYIYHMLANEVSPYDYVESVERKEYGQAIETTKVQEYYYYSYFYNREEFLSKDFEDKEIIIIVSKLLPDVASEIVKKGYESHEYKGLYVFVNQDLDLNL